MPARPSAQPFLYPRARPSVVVSPSAARASIPAQSSPLAAPPAMPAAPDRPSIYVSHDPWPSRQSQQSYYYIQIVNDGLYDTVGPGPSSY